MPDDSHIDALFTDGSSATSSDAAVRKALLTSPILLHAYAVCIVILAVGVVALFIAIGVLSFWHPDKAELFWQMLGSFIVGLVIDVRGASATAARVIKSNGNGNSN